MVKAVVVDKNSNKKESALNYDYTEFYKKCNYRNNNNFDVRHTWEFKEQGETYYISVFAKDKGRANSENKYDLPPPVDSTLYYGTLLIVKTFTKGSFEKDNLDNLTLEEWEKCYEKLFGGFESLEDDSEEPDELDDISESEKTEGYHRMVLLWMMMMKKMKIIYQMMRKMMKVKQKIQKKQMKKLWGKIVI